MKLICKCTNSDCQDFGKEKEMEWDGVSSFKLLELKKCPSCHQNMTVQNREANLNEAQKLESIATPTIDSMTPQQRKQLLKERSNRDFKKNIEPQKRWMDKNVIPR